MQRNLLEKLKESAQSVLPVCFIVLALHVLVAPLPSNTLLLFLIGAVLLLAGMTIFALGVEMAIMPMGDHIGSGLIQSRNIWFLVAASFILGAAVTAAEPDLHVLANQIPTVPTIVVVLIVAIGGGAFLVIALLRILLQIRLSWLLTLLYALVFVAAILAAPDYLAVAFDSGGVTTGPVTVPLILALGGGVAAVRGSRSAEADSFGLLGISSIGPIIAVLIMGLFFDSSVAEYGMEPLPTAGTLAEGFQLYAGELMRSAQEISVSLAPIVVIFGVYQVLRLHLPPSQIIRMVVGIVYTMFGLTLFLAGVNIGFLPAGTALGSTIGAFSNNWILIPIGFIIGFVVVAAEPAVLVLNKQVEEITSGAISRNMMMASLSVGVGLALVMALARILMGTSIWFFLLPGYAVALALTFFVPEMFTAIAFDSGGVAAGTMAAAFLLPFTIGVSEAVGGNLLTDAFGIIGLIAMMPLVTVQILGMLYTIRLRQVQLEMPEEVETVEPEIDIIEF
ncbi:MAG: DUF1538 domain-containing protein [Chloroflexota bacterium]|nr:MAG: DUF1538 domain-containing protein [Chloroflexota bacterium]